MPNPDFTIHPARIHEADETDSVTFAPGTFAPLGIQTSQAIPKNEMWWIAPASKWLPEPEIKANPRCH